MKKYWLIITMAVFVFSVGIFRFYFHAAQPVAVNIEFVGCLEKIGVLQWDNWFIVNDQQKKSEVESDALTEICDMGNFKMDFDKYTYIFVDGFEMVKLSYIPNDCRRRFSAFPDYYGYAILERAEDKMYVYRIPSDLHIVKDPHAHYENDFRTTILD